MSEPPIALVTGASRGIGRAIVELLLARGRRVVAVARDAEALAQLEDAHPDHVTALPIDLTMPGAAVWAVEEATRRAGPIRELVLAAGIVKYAPLGAVSEPALRAQLELNFIASFNMLQDAGVLMRSQGQGSIVAIASTLAFRAAPTTAAYAASKGALVSAAAAAALELAPKVRVNVVAPGVVDTDMVRVARRPLAPDEEHDDVVDAELEALRALHPLQRLGRPDDVAKAVLYLLEAEWVTGSVLTVDGGLSLR